MKIVYDIEAREQVGEIFRYGKEHFGWNAAMRYKNTLRKSISALKQNPLMGCVEQELCDGGSTEYRYLLVKPYKVIYSVKGDVIRVHLFWHTSREPRTLANNLE